MKNVQLTKKAPNRYHYEGVLYVKDKTYMLDNKLADDLLSKTKDRVIVSGSTRETDTYHLFELAQEKVQKKSKEPDNADSSGGTDGADSASAGSTKTGVKV